MLKIIKKYDIKIYSYIFKEEKIMAKKQRDISKIFGRIMAGFLAVLMVLGVGATLIYCLVAM